MQLSARDGKQVGQRVVPDAAVSYLKFLIFNNSIRKKRNYNKDYAKHIPNGYNMQI